MGNKNFTRKKILWWLLTGTAGEKTDNYEVLFGNGKEKMCKKHNQVIKISKH